MPRSGPRAYRPPSSSPLAQLSATAHQLLSASLSHSTRAAYLRAWGSFQNFLLAFDVTPVFPVPSSIMLMFIAHLHQKGYSASTIASQASAIGFVHKLHCVSDPYEAFVVKKALLAVRKGQQPKSQRLPITLEVLKKLVLALPEVISNVYRRCLFKAMFLIAFHGFLRVGEMTKSVHNLQRHQICLTKERITIHFQSFKHSDGAAETRHILQIPSSPFCPCSALRAFLLVRGEQPGPLFISEGNPLSRQEFVLILKRTLDFAGFQPDKYNSHSFRIGAATSYAHNGASDAQIRSLGRWKSDAFKLYIRAPAALD